MKLGCVVMAAGKSSRFGENKLAQVLEGRSLIQRTLDAIPRELFSQVVVVTGDDAVASLAGEYGFSVVENRQPEKGVSHTISLGLSRLIDCDGVLFTVSDQPMLRQATISRLVQGFLETPDGIVAAAHDGKRGNPCLFSKAFFPELLTLSGDTGGSAVIRRHEDALRLVETAAQELADCDTKEDLEMLRGLKPSP